MHSQSHLHSALPDSVALMLPPGWVDVPLEETDQRAFLEVVFEGLSSDSVSAADRRQIEFLITRVAAMLRSERVVLAAAFVADSVESAEDLLGAAVAVSVIGRAALGTDVPLLPDVLVEGFSRFDRQDGDLEFVDIEPPKVRVVGGFTMVELLRLARSRDSIGGGPRQFVKTLLVPVARGDGLVILNFATFNVDRAREFSELFEKIAGTLRILYPDDPTFDDDVSEADGDSASPGETVD